jgi:hypothetical protein
VRHEIGTKYKILASLYAPEVWASLRKHYPNLCGSAVCASRAIPNSLRARGSSRHAAMNAENARGAEKEQRSVECRIKVLLRRRPARNAGESVPGGFENNGNAKGRARRRKEHGPQPRPTSPESARYISRGCIRAPQPDPGWNSCAGRSDPTPASHGTREPSFRLRH